MAAQAPTLPKTAEPPRAIGSGDEQDRDALREVSLRFKPRPSRLEAPVSSLKGAGPKLSARAAGIGLETIGDLLWHLPHGYRDRSNVLKIGELRLGEEATVIVEVRKARVRPTRNRRLRIVEADVADASGATKAIWFNQAWLLERLRPGTRLLLSGKLDRSAFKVSAHEIIGADGVKEQGIHTVGLVPVHSVTDGLSADRVREWVWSSAGFGRDAIEALPAELRASRGLAGAGDALVSAHFPWSPEDAEEARRRLAFEELFLHQIALAARRRGREDERPGVPLEGSGEMTPAWVASLPFALTEGQREACEEIDEDLASGRPMQRLLMGEVGSGKAQPLDALVLTQHGFREMGSLRVGDEVANPTGEPSQVTGVFPQGKRDVYRVSFSDGTSAECDLEHLWEVRTSQARCLKRQPKVKTTRELLSDLGASNGAAKWHVELPEAVELDSGGDRPVDPYLLGLLLGDGGLSIPNRVTFSTADDELVEAVRLALPVECVLFKEGHRPYDWSVRKASIPPPECLARVRRGSVASYVQAYDAGAGTERIAKVAGISATTVRYHLLKSGVRMRPSSPFPCPLRRALRELDLMGKKSLEKAVPLSYLEAPISDRHALLQGLMDADGTLLSTGLNITFTSASKELAENVAWLCRSLAGRARIRKPKVINGRSYWTVALQLPDAFPPFRLARKAKLLKPRTKYKNPAKAIVAIEKVGRAEMQCISVSHPNQLYVTDGFTVTHNTVVALHAMLRAVESGHQAALMAPTETLAEQHANTLNSLLASTHIPFTLLTGATKAAARRDALGRLESGELGLIVGTHALIEDDVRFARLAVCVVDEQHRFGVRQRAALDAKGPELADGSRAAPHVLHMTATPIPRTLSLTAYGDLDATTLRELPAGRQPVKTWAVGEEKREGAYEFVRERLREGRQAFFVCPLVEGSEKLEAKAASEEAERLATGEFTDFRVALLHGQMHSRDKAAAMEAFAAGEADVLVATSVIEVGIDVPNATVMVVEGAERYGLSQLHQLRGRVGRGEHESFCILFGDPASDTARRRLEAITTERDGFKLAEVDLSLRGEGEILGTLQSGLPRFKAARLPEDGPILVDARREAIALQKRFDSLEDPELGPLLHAVRLRFGDERVEGMSA